MRRIFTILVSGLGFGLGGTNVYAQLTSVDAGARAQDIAGWDQSLLETWSRDQPWLRIRGLPNPTIEANAAAVAKEVAALERLVAAGFKPIPFLYWGSKSWPGGVRPGGWKRVPLDLREMYARSLAYGAAYGHTGAVFEIENEPDIGFVEDNPETYMAFLKAGYLGLKEGALRQAQTIRDNHKAISEGEEREAGRGVPAEPGLGGAQTDSGLGRSPEAGCGDSALQLPHDRSAARRENAGQRVAAITPVLGTPQPASRDSLPLVVMAPLALPPGPYFEQLVKNGLFSYTDGINYHYYGYADDFSGVYRQFEAAVNDLSKPEFLESAHGGRSLQPSGLPLVSKTLPVLITEYGYGSLSGTAAATVAGRVNQWRWFQSVGTQVRRLRIAGPMAFYLPPYLEVGAKEFGLTLRSREKTEAGDQGDEDSGRNSARRSPSVNDGPQVSAPQFQAGDLTFTPRDFGRKKAEPWMQGIGRKFGASEASPALAWLWAEGVRKPYRPKNWTVRAAAPSPVVMDFIAGPGLVQQKRYGGYVATAEAGDGAKAGTGELVLYNFSNKPVRGRLVVVQGRDLLTEAAAVERVWELQPLDRVIVPVTLQVSAETFARHELALRFEHPGNSPLPDTGRREGARALTGLTAVYSTALFPDAEDMQETLLDDFGSADSALGAPPRSGLPASATRLNRALLTRRPLAKEEPRLAADGRWLVTRGVQVEEAVEGTWRFHITDFPEEPIKPASAELPLPDDFSFPDDGMLRFTYRLTYPPKATVENGKDFSTYFRTANGNLYQVWPRQHAMEAWSAYTEVKANFSVAFYGRAALPWRFRDNRPVALVFKFRPGAKGLPATYEVKDVRMVRLGDGS